MIIVIGFICFCLGASIGSCISGHVAYEEGVTDERRKWYVHAEDHHWKEEDFIEDKED